jgi:hypothetical protein
MYTSLLWKTNVLAAHSGVNISILLAHMNKFRYRSTNNQQLKGQLFIKICNSLLAEVVWKMHKQH